MRLLNLNSKSAMYYHYTAIVDKFHKNPIPNIINAPYGTERMTVIVLRGTQLLSLFLISLLILNGFITDNIQVVRIIIGFVILLYLLTIELLVRFKKFLLAAWLLVAMYAALASSIVLTWGINASTGILAVSFTVVVAGTILGTKYITFVTVNMVFLLVLVQAIHDAQLVTPDTSSLSLKPHYGDVLSYATFVAIFALVSWLSGKQTEHSIRRALKAEQKIKAEKLNLVSKLKEQSSRLKFTQLQEMANLYKFASIGQTTTATLHELSNQLSILSLDIDDLQQRHQQSKAINNAKEGINNINSLVRQMRKQIQDNKESIRFNAVSSINTTLDELIEKCSSKKVTIRKSIPKQRSFYLIGDPLNLSHVITILINNALDACSTSREGKVEAVVTVAFNQLDIHIKDNGQGLPVKHDSLFVPHKSIKPNGLGIGLYITKQIVENQFHGSIAVKSLASGTEFCVTLPKSS
jgi:signal transduction histidine kinase